MQRRREWLRRGWIVLGAACVLVLSAACGSAGKPVSTAEEGAPAKSAASTTATAATATPPPLKALTFAPEIAYIGTNVTVTGKDLPAGKSAEFFIDTVSGGYETKVDLGSIEFLTPTYKTRRLSIGKAPIDAQGELSASLTLPEDYASDTRSIYAVVDGKDVAKGGVFVQRSAKVSVSQGPVGTPITIEVVGLGSSGFQSTIGVRWDNKYVGFMSSTTTNGSARATIRAAGPPGEHFIDLGPASAAVPYLNPQQTPRKIVIPTYRFSFTVTEDAGAPAPAIEWPDARQVAEKPTLPLSPNIEANNRNGVTAKMNPSSGPILSTSTLDASGFPPSSAVDIVWRTVTGSDVTGWQGADHPMTKSAVGADGKLSAALNIPEGLGGWHTIMLLTDGKPVAEVPYYVERSLVTDTPRRVKAGEKFNVQIKGVGWTELDNGVAVLYDNNYVGYACGFGSGGDVTVELVATGGPGTHLIELYPMIYNRGFSKRHYWNYEVPHLNFQQDHPGLGLGYRLPVFRLAVEITD